MASAQPRSWVDNPQARTALTVVAVGLILFDPIWTTIRFSSLFGRLLSMQLAYDEPFYFWELYQQVADGVLALDYRLFSKLLAAGLLSMGLSYDATMTLYDLVNPLAAFAAALVLAGTWERWSAGRLVWALLLVFSFDFLSGSSRVIDYVPPASRLQDLVGDPALLRADVLSFFEIYRRPEPQSSWIALFLYWALLLSGFLRWRRGVYLWGCAVTPLLAFLHVNVAVAALLTFVLLSLCALILYRRPIAVPFVLSLAATVLVYVVCFSAAGAPTKAAQYFFHTHMPMLRPSLAFAVAGLVWAGLAIRRQGATPGRIAAIVFFATPVIVLDQQLLTGIAVLPQNWDLYANYLCIVVGAGLMSGPFLSSLERRHDWRQFLSVGLLAFMGYIIVQGAWRNELFWSLENVRSVLFGEVYMQSAAKVGRIDGVILPHLFDESLFVTRVPRGTKVLGGYSMRLTPVPDWRDDETFEQHAQAAKSSFATGFEVLFRSGVTPRQLQANMEAELKTGDCWLGLSYFFSLGDCWPSFLNFTSPATKRLPGAVPAIVEMYRRYLEREAAGDLARRPVLLVRNEALPADKDGLIDNQLVGLAEVDMRGTRVRAYAYIQRPKRGE